jgi:hypothetical protein
MRTFSTNSFTYNPAMQQFIIETLLINPVKDIVYKLENKEFRDCDVKWLNDKLYNFTNFAAETLGKKFEYKTNEFIKAFKTLLNYFKSF